mmetsp:Transcript_4711/g.21073  ORF Transcript_4711/g.21073 Transcript_4711/m.21073 type:complete len:334 (+) Transcript_4711:1419-2420(+)
MVQGGLTIPPRRRRCDRGSPRRRTRRVTRTRDWRARSSGGVTRGRGSSPRFARRRRTAASASSPWRRPSRASARGAGFTPRLRGWARRLPGSGGPRLRSKTISCTRRRGWATRFSRFRDSVAKPRRVTRRRTRVARARSRSAAVTCPPPRQNRTVRRRRLRWTGWCPWRRKTPGWWLRMSNFATTSRLTRWSVGGKPPRARTRAGSSHPPWTGSRSATGRCTTRARLRRSARNEPPPPARRSSPPRPGGQPPPRPGRPSPSHGRRSRGRRRTRHARTARARWRRRTALDTPRNSTRRLRERRRRMSDPTPRLPSERRRGSPSSWRSARRSFRS